MRENVKRERGLKKIEGEKHGKSGFSQIYSYFWRSPFKQPQNKLKRDICLSLVRKGIERDLLSDARSNENGTRYVV